MKYKSIFIRELLSVLGKFFGDGIYITRTHNGATAHFPEGGPLSYQFEEGDMRGLQGLLYNISDTLETGSRYARERIKIEVVHGDKFEHSNKEEKKACKICNPA